MAEESPNRIPGPAGAVFLSYASQDAAAAEHIADVLRAAGIEVWFDKTELRGGDAWDRKIREQINECALFVPVMSANAHARTEGYFRFEWKLAIDRSHRMAPDQAFLFPVVIDDTPQTDKRIPERFRELQWSRAPAGEAAPVVIERIRRLLTAAESDSPPPGRPTAASPPRSRYRPGLSKWAAGVAITVAVTGFGAYIAYERLWTAKRVVTPPTPPAAPTSAASVAFNPPPHSIAVLPFLNMSGDKEQEYFSDGLTEEILNSLARIGELQVSARTSSFSFKGKDTDLATIAHKLNVGSVLEGSVRRSGQTVRVTAQLNNAITGFHLWSQTYDRDLSDVLKLQAEIANAVASALRVTLLGDVTARVEVGGTRNPLAFDAYLRGLRLARVATSEGESRQVLDEYGEAIRLDPNFALAYAARSLALLESIYQWGRIATHQQNAEKARIDADQAIALAPSLGVAHAALARYLLAAALDYPRASEESERALALAPGNAIVLSEYSQQAAYMGRFNAAIDSATKGVALDPLNLLSHRALGDALRISRRYTEAIVAYQDAIAVDPGPPESYARIGLAYYALGSYEMARASCERKPDYWESRLCLALTLEKLGQRRESDAHLKWLREFYGGEQLSYQYAQIYAQRADHHQALQWLETALRQRDPGFRRLKTDPLMDPLRKEPRFEAIEQELNFPE